MAKRKYAHRNLITRTIYTTSGDVTFFNTDTKQNSTEHLEISGYFNAEKFLAKIVKMTEKPMVAIMVENVDVTEKLYGITVEKFLENAEEITD